MDTICGQATRLLRHAPDVRSNVDWGDDGDRLNELVKNNDKGSSEFNPGLLTTYAHMIGSNKGHTNNTAKSNLALSYLFRALALQPDNFVVNLSIATSYLAMSMRDDTPNNNTPWRRVRPSCTDTMDCGSRVRQQRIYRKPNTTWGGRGIWLGGRTWRSQHMRRR